MSIRMRETTAMTMPIVKAVLEIDDGDMGLDRGEGGGEGEGDATETGGVKLFSEGVPP
jgi:hypothetical protein